MSVVYTVPLKEVIREFQLEEIFLPEGSDTLVSRSDLNRPGLALAGFFAAELLFEPVYNTGNRLGLKPRGICETGAFHRISRRKPGAWPREECGLSKVFNLGPNAAKPCT